MKASKTKNRFQTSLNLRIHT